MKMVLMLLHHSMKWISFNCRGLASPAKNLALRRLFESERLDVIFIQETLENSEQIVTLLKAMVKGCTVE